MMAWQPVLLWSDLAFWLVTGLAVWLVWRTRRSGSAAWRRLFALPAGAAASVILLAFLLIAMLDSLHFRDRLPGTPVRYDVAVKSVLDVVLQPINSVPEKTYSAPLARHLFIRIQVSGPDGLPRREFAELNSVRLHPAPADLPRQAIWYGVAAGVGLLLVVQALFWLRGRSLGKAAWAMLATSVLLVAILTFCAAVAGHLHVLGTDKVGQDVLFEALKSIRTDLLFGLLATLLTLPLGVGLGMTAGYFGGWVDDAIQYVYTVMNSIPDILLIAAVVLLMQGYMETHAVRFDTSAARGDIRLLLLCLILGVTSWTGLCRVLRAETLKLRELDYVHAARAFGVSHGRVLLRHILPNLGHLILITLVMDFSGLVLTEAVLTYLGLGVDASMASWGNMINAAELELARDPVVWWPLAGAFSLMFTLVLSANIFADSIQIAFDPLGARA